MSDFRLHEESKGVQAIAKTFNDQASLLRQRRELAIQTIQRNTNMTLSDYPQQGDHVE